MKEKTSKRERNLDEKSDENGKETSETSENVNVSEKNLKDNNCKEIFLKILERERKNGLSKEIYNNGKSNFLKRFGNINFNNYYINDPFKESGEALYYWSPIADELKL